MILIATHTRFDEHEIPVHGTGSEIITFLEMKHFDYLYVQHSIFTGSSTLVTLCKKRNKIKKFIGITTLPFPLRVIQECIITFQASYKTSSIFSVFIGIDPVNGLFGLLLKKIGKVKFVIFYTADYAPQRFTNNFLNTIYHALDRYVISHADQVWNVSSRIVSVREKQAISKNKIIFIPNSPVYHARNILPLAEINPFDLIIVSHISKSINFPLLINAIKMLVKKFPKIRLIVIGNGEYKTDMENLVDKLGLKKQVLFLGHLNHLQVMKQLQKSAIGVAIYTNEQPWTSYGDSMKVREYLACGLPVVVTNVPSTADDIDKEKAGIVIQNNLEDFHHAIDTLLTNKKLYTNMRKNAITLAKKYDFKCLMETYFPKGNI